MKGISELKKIAKEKLDLVLMNYSVFEDSSYLSKSFRAPVLLIDDGNPSVRKVPALDNPVIRNDIQYEWITANRRKSRCASWNIFRRIFQAESSTNHFWNRLSPNPAMNSPRPKALVFSTRSHISDMSFSIRRQEIFIDREKSPPRGIRSSCEETVYGLGGKYRIDLLVTNGAVYEFARTLSDPPPDERYLLDYAHVHHAIELTELSDTAERELYRRITDDRNRLSALLELFLANPEYRREVAALKKAIEERKKLFAHEHTRHMHHKPKSSGFIDTLRASIGSDASTGSSASGSGAGASSNVGGFAGKILRAVGLSSVSTAHSSGIHRKNSPVRLLSVLLKKSQKGHCR
jgi:hypothetical protein